MTQIIPKFKMMNPNEYVKWSKNPLAKEASLPSFHRNGFKRTLNVLEGDVKPESVKRWRSFVGRYGSAFNENPTRRRAIALRNWGVDIEIPEED